MKMELYALFGVAIVLAGCAGVQAPGASAGGSQAQLMCKVRRISGSMRPRAPFGWSR